jgi:hypothetical protein
MWKEWNLSVPYSKNYGAERNPEKIMLRYHKTNVYMGWILVDQVKVEMVLTEMHCSC